MMYLNENTPSGVFQLSNSKLKNWDLEMLVCEATMKSS